MRAIITTKKSGEEMREEPRFDDKGMTQWYWRVLHPENLRLGKNIQIGSFTVIDAMESVEIEDNVKIGFGCIILSYSSIDKKGGRVVLKKNSKIGSNTVIMPGVTVGKNAFVGANSFVNRDIPANEVWAGSPIRCLRKSERSK
jgi:acetyltransferase-like isoleucine patch superfamily enzyme